MSVGSPVTDKPRVLIAGGGIAGMEALLALADLAKGRVELVLAAPEPDFRYRPMAVVEPFSLNPYERRALAPAVEEVGGRFVEAGIRAVRPDDHVAGLDDGSKLEYATLAVCVGARPGPAFESAFVFTVPGPQLDIGAAIDRAAGSESNRIAFVVPSGVTWALPIYELALLTARLVAESGEAIEVVIVTPESSPLAVFGPEASAAVGQLLRARRIRIRPGAHVHQAADGVLVLAPGEEELRAGAIVALPLLKGPKIEGLPSDENGFIPIDDHGRVQGVEDVYAAGDGTNFPIKQGGLGTQQADAAAEHIAARHGGKLEPAPFHPVLRGKLIVGEETMSMRAEIVGGGGEGLVSSDYLWWPPLKVSGRYLSPWLAGSGLHLEAEPPARSIDVEVSLPHEWHRDPMALDPTRDDSLTG